MEPDLRSIVVQSVPGMGRTGRGRLNAMHRMVRATRQLAAAPHKESSSMKKFSKVALAAVLVASMGSVAFVAPAMAKKEEKPAASPKK